MLEVGFVLGESNVLAVGACRLLLQGVAATLVALVVDLTRVSVLGVGVVGPRARTLASSRFFIVLCMGFSASLASWAGMISFLSTSLTSSIMSVLSSAKAVCSAATRSRVGWGVSAATWALRPAFSAPNGLKMV